MHHAAKSFHLETTPVQDSNTAAPIVHYSEVFDFGSGCICCSPDGDLTRLLTSLAASIEAGEHRAPSILFIEVTGLGDPRPFIRLLGAMEGIRNKFRLAQILAVLHGVRCVEQFAEPGSFGSCNKALEQLKAATVVVLNRQPQSSVLTQVAAAVAEHNPAATFLGAAEQGDLSYERLIGAGVSCGPECAAEGIPEDDDAFMFVKPPGGHDATYMTMSVVEAGGVHGETFLSFLRSLVEVALGCCLLPTASLRLDLL